MIGNSNVFKFGHVYLSEVKRLLGEGSIDPEEAAALMAQIHELCEAGADLNLQQHSPNGLLGLLPDLVGGREIQSMAEARTCPMTITTARKRRYGTYCRIRRAAMDEFMADSKSMCQQYAQAREWPLYAREEWRRISARYLFAYLGWAGLKFRMGFRADVKRLTARLSALTLDLPRRGDCMA